MRQDNKKKEKYKKGSTNTYTSVWLIEEEEEEDLRARLPVLFEGTKYENREREQLHRKEVLFLQ